MSTGSTSVDRSHGHDDYGTAPLMRWAYNVFVLVALCISCCDLKLLSLGDGAVTVQVVASGVCP